jgi:hypothetical protein
MADGKNLSRASIWLDVKFPVRIASHKLLEAGEIGAAGGSMPILMLSSTSPRLDVGMCDNGRAAIRVLIFTMGCRLIGTASFGGLAIKGGGRSIRTSSMNRVSRRAASRGVASSAIGGTDNSSRTGDNGVGSVVRRVEASTSRESAIKMDGCPGNDAPAEGLSVVAATAHGWVLLTHHGCNNARGVIKHQPLWCGP